MSRRYKGTIGKQRTNWGGRAIGLGVVVGLVGLVVLLTSGDSKGQEVRGGTMNCHEDQVLVWVDAPHTTECRNIDDLIFEWLG